MTSGEEGRETKAGAPDGGPAFPGKDIFIQEIYDHYRPTEGIHEAKRLAQFKAPGMSLRDYFAGQALLGLLAGGDRESLLNPDKAATYSGDYADAMLEERRKR